MNRIIDFSEEGVSLRTEHRQLVMEWPDGRKRTTPLCEIASVILTHWRISLTKTVLQELAKAKAVVVVCDEKFLPVGMFVPLTGHYLQGKIMREQASASEKLRKKAWKEIIQAKILAQGQVLTEVGKKHALNAVARTVKSGDSTNREAYAARIYWQALFGESDFVRNPEGEDSVNSALNYGYAILRSLTARAATAGGLNSSLGIFHHNQYDSYCLANDLMEPFRPIVDWTVYQLFEKKRLTDGLTREIRGEILTVMQGRLVFREREETIFEVLSKVVSAFTDFMGGRSENLILPRFKPEHR